MVRLAALLIAAVACEAATSNVTAADFIRKLDQLWRDVFDGTTQGPTLTLPDGKLTGRTDKKSGVDIFWSVPFAEPPEGDLRFAPPVPAKPWNGTRDSTMPPRWCPQIHLTHNFFFGVEDCLYLDVYVPPGVKPGDKVPVMFWIFGGAWIIGDPMELGWYDGRNIAKQQNVIMVAPSYRVNSLGLLALDSMMEEHGTAGSMWLLDQQLALKWTQRNIHLFGGDPDKVTIFGESAGGCAVLGQLAMPSSRGLFRAAIAESALAGTDDVWVPLKNATAWGRNWAKEVGCGQEGAAQLACLRSKPLKDVLNPLILWRTKYPDAAPGTLPLLMPVLPWFPVVDGNVVPACPHELAAKGQITDVPLLIGTNHNEGTIFAPLIPLIVPGTTLPLMKSGLRKTLEHFMPPQAVDMVLKEYPPSSGGSFLDPLRYTRIAAHIIRDWLFICAGRRLVRLMNGAGRKNAVRVYHFTYKMHGVLDKLGGDYHTSELSYVFDNPWLAHIWPIGTWGKVDKQLSGEMQSYWGSFARSSNSSDPLETLVCAAPDSSACISWPRYTRAAVDSPAGPAGTRNVMIFDEKLSIQDGLYEEQCDMWDKVGYAGVHP
eukprot:TRINITY_DN146_c2_g1_i1.p2 TRINITY_DN146_c2_g1~~TRINITY_DN146_c2_g1_i1.p2  ORF type:complete len:598 (+),score=191.61 TRINITY_DN146_c2_g1_i1:148-1941(+)